QPSPGSRLVSSQPSSATTRPSPHTVAHSLGTPSQAQPLSSTQSTLQPSLLSRLSSSHSSCPTSRPSPPPSKPSLGRPLHSQPSSITHMELQPSRSSALPSSQSSPSTSNPSPQPPGGMPVLSGSSPLLVPSAGIVVVPSVDGPVVPSSGGITGASSPQLASARVVLDRTTGSQIRDRMRRSPRAKDTGLRGLPKHSSRPNPGVSTR